VKYISVGEWKEVGLTQKNGIMQKNIGNLKTPPSTSIVMKLTNNFKDWRWKKENINIKLFIGK